jgi:hypothetical protein
MIELATTAFQLVSWLAEQAQRAQSANAPDWAKYVTAGAYVMAQAGQAVVSADTAKFDKMTPQEIRDYLTPPTWDQL